jgi:hypothetical protein
MRRVSSNSLPMLLSSEIVIFCTRFLRGLGSSKGFEGGRTDPGRGGMERAPG